MSNAKQLPHNTEEWKGYTLEEIRYARAYTAARMELNRERLTARARDMQKNGLKPGVSKGMLGKMLGAFSYIDIALLTWRVGRKLFRVTRAIKGK
ncbi:hypothetical protein [Duncaniella muricolitica]|jgi:hypothetical protein|uniref:hypothetical protein n=1 Tax=Duncaniella muricolitica TaxID=2880704 RepID=UPI00244DEB9C|nr:hypothetical protein [Duncaniella muricolitica]